MQICTYTYVQTYRRTDVHEIYVHSHIRTCAHRYMHTYAYTHIHTYILTTMLEIKKKCSLNFTLLNVLPYEL